MGREIEAKFYLRHLPDCERRAEAAGATLVAPRVLETNLRFDTTGSEFRSSGRVLRLRQDQHAWLTYKDREAEEDGVLGRREFEFSVGDFAEARQFLEALGYRVVLIYEKFRTTYKLRDVQLMFDEMPYGDFLEIEGESAALKQAAEQFHLNWRNAIPSSYSALFDRLRAQRNLEFGDLTFDNFRGLSISADDLGVQPADE